MKNYDYDDIDYEDEDIDFLEENPEERRQMHVGRLRVAAGVMDFLSVIGGMVMVLVMVAILISLINWLVTDVGQTFSLLQRRLK